MLNNLKAFYINLALRTDRRSIVEANFERVGLSPERISAVSSSEVKAPNPVEGYKKIKDCEYACLLSHKKALEQCTDKLLIFEDDVDFVPNFNEKFNYLLENVPDDFELLYLGVWTNGDFEIVKPGIARVRDGLSAHAYIITKSAVDAILPEFDGKHGQNDVVMYNFNKRGTSYAAIPCIAYQSNSYSDLKGWEAPTWTSSDYPYWCSESSSTS